MITRNGQEAVIMKCASHSKKIPSSSTWVRWVCDNRQAIEEYIKTGDEDAWALSRVPAYICPSSTPFGKTHRLERKKGPKKTITVTSSAIRSSACAVTTSPTEKTTKTAEKSQEREQIDARLSGPRNGSARNSEPNPGGQRGRLQETARAEARSGRNVSWEAWLERRERPRKTQKGGKPKGEKDSRKITKSGGRGGPRFLLGGEEAVDEKSTGDLSPHLKKTLKGPREGLKGTFHLLKGTIPQQTEKRLNSKKWKRKTNNRITAPGAEALKAVGKKGGGTSEGL